MPNQRPEGDSPDRVKKANWRTQWRDSALRSALQKRAAGVPSYSVPEAAALLSISQEHLYRIVRGGDFPAVRMRRGGDQGRYVIPAKAIEKLLNDATAGGCMDSAEWSKTWHPSTPAPDGWS